MLPLPPVAPATGWRHRCRLPRDYYVRLDSNDYSVHPAVIGRRVEVVADLDRVRAFCDGKLVADHDRVWARHQTISAPSTSTAAKLLRRERIGLLRPAPSPRSRSAAWPTTTPRSACDTRSRRGWPDAATRQPAADPAAEIAYLTRALKAPTLRECGRAAGRTGPGRVLDA